MPLFDDPAISALGGQRSAHDDLKLVADRGHNPAPNLKEDLKRLEWYRQNRKSINDDVYKYGTPVDFGAGNETLRPYWEKHDKKLIDAMKKAGLKPRKDEIDVWEEGDYANRQDLKPSSQFKIDANKKQSPIELGQQLVGTNEFMNADVIGNFLSQAMGKKIDPRRVAWCTYFVSSLLKATGRPYVDRNPGAAKAYLNFGTDVSDDPQPGDLWVSSGHVAIVLGIGSNPNTVRTLEGNHDDGVSEGERGITEGSIRRPPLSNKER